LQSYAQTSYTVNNDPAASAQFHNLQEAIHAAANGDTIHIAGSPIPYGDVTLAKRLILIGAGYSDITGFKSVISNLTLETSSDNAPPSGSIIIGIYFMGKIDAFENYIISDVLVANCQFVSSFSFIDFRKADAWIIRNNWFGNSVGNLSFSHETTNMLVEGNIFSDHNAEITSNNDLTIGGQNAAEVLFTNNYFFTVDIALNNAIFQNNVFSNCTFTADGNRTFRNNLFYLGTAPDDPTCDFQENLEGNPLFVDEGDAPGVYNFTNIRLQENSPGRHAGTDGTDIGIYGGDHPFKTFSPNQEIKLLHISPTTATLLHATQKPALVPSGTYILSDGEKTYKITLKE